VVEETIDDCISHHLRDTGYARLCIIEWREAPCRYLHTHCLHENNYEFKIKRLRKNNCARNVATSAYFPTCLISHEGLVSCLHGPATGPYPELGESCFAMVYQIVSSFWNFRQTSQQE
jgi:hypothetical protein